MPHPNNLTAIRAAALVAAGVIFSTRMGTEPALDSGTEVTGRRCLKARGPLGLTQAVLARKLGCSPAVISKFERTGHMAQPMVSRQDRLTEFKVVFERAGEFTSDAPAGLRLRKLAR